MSGPKITIARKSGVKALMKRVSGITKLSAHVGIPASGSDRDAALKALAGKTTSAKKKAKLAAASGDVNNAELLFVFSKGSPARNQPARPVLEPAVQASDNKAAITKQLAASVKADIAGDHKLATTNMRKAALAGQNAARKWFTDGRNGWAPNAPSTIEAKGSDRPGINTGAMRSAIVGVVEDA